MTQDQLPIELPGRTARALVGDQTITLHVPPGKECMTEVHLAKHWWPIVAIRQGVLVDADGTPKITVDYREHDGRISTIPETSWTALR